MKSNQTIITLFAKSKEHEGKKWTNFSTLKNGEWYSVRFVKECNIPKVYEVTEGIKRAFVGLTAKNTFNVAESDYGKILYVENFRELSEDEIKNEIEKETQRVVDYRKKREAEKMSFLDDSPKEEVTFSPAKEDDEDLPF